MCGVESRPETLDVFLEKRMRIAIPQLEQFP